MASVLVRNKARSKVLAWADLRKRARALEIGGLRDERHIISSGETKQKNTPVVA